MRSFAARRAYLLFKLVLLYSVTSEKKRLEPKRITGYTNDTT